MRIESNQFRLFIAATALTISLIHLSSSVHAQTSAAPPPPPPIFGMIVSVRGNIYQVRQPYLKNISRFLATDQTQFMDRQSAPVSVLKPGMRVVAYGPRAKSGAIDIKFLRASSNQSAFSRWGMQKGISPDLGDGPDWVQLGGRLKSLSPFTVVDDSNILIPASLSIANLKFVDFWIQSGKSQLMIGRKAFVIGNRRESDILLASQVFLMRSPGNPGTIFGGVVSVNGNRLVVMPRFGTQTITVSIDPKVKIQRQISQDPDKIKIGQRITVWGGHSADSDDLSQLTAYVVMPGVEAFPSTSLISLADPTSIGRDVTGIVTGFNPMTLQAKRGVTFVVTVPGQTPTATFIPARLGALRKGVSVMLVCTSGKTLKSPLVARVIVFDASPIVALGL